jgi:hypothetical protein
MLIGFALAAYSIIANDSIQTLGTFLSSNAKRPWWALWLWISAILVVTVVWGWSSNGGDPAFGRLDKKGIEFPGLFNWLYVVPPLVLVLLTRSGIPVSTSFLVLTAFSSLTAVQLGQSTKAPQDLFVNMLQKSVVGYFLAMLVGIFAYCLIVTAFERTFQSDDTEPDEPSLAWMAFQWLSTGFLWSMWLVQDLANVFVYLPRRLELWAVLASLAGMVALLGLLIRNIPKMFAAMGWPIPWPPKMPMSTTWVFLGLLAGREIGMRFRVCAATYQKGKLSSLISRDLAKVILGTVVSLAVALALPQIARSISSPSQDSGIVAPAVDSTDANTAK